MTAQQKIAALRAALKPFAELLEYPKLMEEEHTQLTVFVGDVIDAQRVLEDTKVAS